MKQNILITGVAGYIGSYLSERFLSNDKYDVVTTNHRTLDLLDRDATAEFFKKNNSFHAIIHCAFEHDREAMSFQDVFYNNSYAFENIARFVNRSKVFISFGSGIEDKIIPNEDFRLSKYIIAQRLKQYSNAVNIKLYRCFGGSEPDDSFVRSCIWKCLRNEPVKIRRNSLTSFFYIDDLYKLVEYYMDNFSVLPKEIEAAYDKGEYLELTRLAAQIKLLTDSTSEITCEDPSYSEVYIGNGRMFESLGIGQGLEMSLIEVINRMKEANV